MPEDPNVFLGLIYCQLVDMKPTAKTAFGATLSLADVMAPLYTKKNITLSRVKKNQHIKVYKREGQVFIFISLSCDKNACLGKIKLLQADQLIFEIAPPTTH